MKTDFDPSTQTDRVRRYTSAEMLEQIEQQIERNIRFFAAQPRHVITQRIEELRLEWSIERYLQVNVSTAGFFTGFMALVGSRKWALLTCTALGFFLYHGLQGYDPPIPILRRMGVRTRREIDREMFALKALRGDFKDLPQKTTEPPRGVEEALQAAKA